MALKPSRLLTRTGAALCAPPHGPVPKNLAPVNGLTMPVTETFLRSLARGYLDAMAVDLVAGTDRPSPFCTSSKRAENVIGRGGDDCDGAGVNVSANDRAIVDAKRQTNGIVKSCRRVAHVGQDEAELRGREATSSTHLADRMGQPQKGPFDADRAPQAVTRYPCTLR